MSYQGFNKLSTFVIIKDQLFDLLINSSYDQICKYYKRICVELIYLVDRLKFRLGCCEHLEESLCECMKIIQAMVQSTEYQKFGHKLPLLKVVIQKYELIKKEELKSKQKKQKRLLKNQESQHYRNIRLGEISSREINFLKREKHIKQFFHNINQNQQIVNNPECVCCSQIFIYKSIITNNNPFIPVVKEISKKKVVDRIFLEKNITAICNLGGGVIIIGAERKEHDLFVTGIRYKSQAQLQDIQMHLLASFENVKPSCKCLIQRIIVHANFSQPQNEISQFMRVCFRILIVPKIAQHINYLQLWKKGCQTVYQIHKLQQKRLQTQQIRSQSIYQQIHKKYKQWKILVNSHKNINCYKRFSGCSKKFLQFYHKNIGNIGKLTMMQPMQEERQEEIIYGDDPVLKYEFQSLIIVASSHQDYHIHNFQAYLAEAKENFDISKLYADSFPECTRSVWLISHEKSHQKLRMMLKSFMQRLSIKTESITMMPVFRSLQFLYDKYTKYMDDIIQTKLRERFKGYTSFTKKYNQYFDSKKHNIRKFVYLNFLDIKWSMYAYMIFENMQYKPYFHSEEEVKKINVGQCGTN